MSRREELRAEWSKLDEKRRKASGEEKATINKEMKDIEFKIRNAGFIDGVMANTDVSVTISVFEQNSCYRGPTVYGSTIGEGCYRRGSGHHI